MTFDLVGLPPEPEEVESFINDKRPDAYERLVDRLLASPHYGERWARHWLDVVHYGESNGFGMDRPRFNAWPYRDYVIQAFNDDKPYDRFVKEQIAGDELYPGNQEALVAMGFNRHWIDETNAAWWGQASVPERIRLLKASGLTVKHSLGDKPARAVLDAVQDQHLNETA